MNLPTLVEMMNVSQISTENKTTIVNSFSSVAYAWVRGAKTTGSLVFLKSNFLGSEKFKVSAHVLPK
jgi:hypothetical protein